MSAVWSNLYAGAFEDCIQAIELSKKENRPNHQAIALVMKAYIGYNLTTIYGDVPYTKAGLGHEGTIAVPYDTQVDVLNACASDLDLAISLLDPSSPFIATELASNDLIYAGDMSLWKKFANSLKVRIFLTLTSGGVNKTADINTIIASGDVFASGADDAKLNYFPSPSTNSNPIYLWVNPSSDRKDDFRMSSSLVEYMRGSSADSANPADKRLPIYADPITNGKYVGGINGATGGQNSTSRLGSGFYNTNTPFYFMSFSELQFIKAELDTTNKTKYDAAVLASFLQNGLTATEANLVLLDPLFTFNAAYGGRLIGEQKWVSLYGQGVEAFNSWRRSGYPKLTKSSNASTVNIPRRMAYNTDEVALNSANVNIGVNGLTPSSDYISSKVWFDRNHPVTFGNK